MKPYFLLLSSGHVLSVFSRPINLNKDDILVFFTRLSHSAISRLALKLAILMEVLPIGGEEVYTSNNGEVVSLMGLKGCLPQERAQMTIGKAFFINSQLKRRKNRYFSLSSPK